MDSVKNVLIIVNNVMVINNVINVQQHTFLMDFHVKDVVQVVNVVLIQMYV